MPNHTNVNVYISVSRTQTDNTEGFFFSLVPKLGSIYHNKTFSLMTWNNSILRHLHSKLESNLRSKKWFSRKSVSCSIKFEELSSDLQESHKKIQLWWYYVPITVMLKRQTQTDSRGSLANQSSPNHEIQAQWVKTNKQVKVDSDYRETPDDLWSPQAHHIKAKVPADAWTHKHTIIKNLKSIFKFLQSAPPQKKHQILVQKPCQDSLWLFITNSHPSPITSHIMTSRNTVVYHLRKHALNQFSHLDSYKDVKKNKPHISFLFFSSCIKTT